MTKTGRYAITHIAQLSRTELLRGNGAHRADSGTGAAGEAIIRIDLKMRVTLGNAANGAVGSAGTAADAVVADFVSHSPILPMQIYRYVMYTSVVTNCTTIRWNCNHFFDRMPRACAESTASAACGELS